jgi:uncharacterized membrane protein
MKYLPLNVKPHAANQSRVTKETHLCIHYFVCTLAIDTVHRLNVLLCTSIIFVQNENKHNKIKIRVITKLPNFEQSYKGKVKTHKYANRKNQSTTGKLGKNTNNFRGPGGSVR